MYRKISAHFIVTNGDTIKNGILTVNNSGEILNIECVGKNIKEVAGLEFYNGILVPGFINTHCHLELSHLRGKIEKHTKLHGFISNIIKQRLDYEEIIAKSAQLYDNKMLANGIVAVGDISNNSKTIKIKQKSEIKYHTFVELFTSNANTVKEVFNRGVALEKQFQKAGLSASITPHAPYSVITSLFELISKHLSKQNSILSIHNQETQSENDLYTKKAGQLYEMFKSRGINLDAIPTTGRSSLKSILNGLNSKIKTILVHNTYSETSDIEAAENHFEHLYWCLCPNANLYIENRLPNIDYFRKKKQKICIGTDSLASNDQLSILDELKVISKAYPKIPFKELISWSTINGAEALNLHKEFGSFELGKKPGINLIENFDFENHRITPDSIVRKIL